MNSSLKQGENVGSSPKDCGKIGVEKAQECPVSQVVAEITSGASDEIQSCDKEE